MSPNLFLFYFEVSLAEKSAKANMGQVTIHTSLQASELA